MSPPLTEKQKQQRRENLAKAREAKVRKKQEREAAAAAAAAAAADAAAQDKAGLVRTNSAEIRDKQRSNGTPATMEQVAEKHARGSPAEPAETRRTSFDDASSAPEPHEPRREVKDVKPGSGAAPETAKTSRASSQADSETIAETSRNASSAHGAGFHAEQPAETGSTPSIEEIARRTQVFNAGSDPIPPPDGDPHMARGITVETPDYAGDGPPTTFDQIFETYAFDGSGDFYATVDRKTPRSYGGTGCAGMQRKIVRHMTREQFAEEYGGGEYMLVVHGPLARGGPIDPNTGHVRRKALTKAIKVTVPLSAYPPNLQASVLDDEPLDEDDPEMYQRGFRRPNRQGTTTNADAEIHRANLTHEERMRDREDAIRREAIQGMPDVSQIISAQAQRDRDIEVEREQTRREEARRREEREQRLEDQLAQARSGGGDRGVMEAMANVITALKQGGDEGGAAALKQAQDEIVRLNDRHQGEVNRLNEKHTAEVTRLIEKNNTDLTALRGEQDRIRDRDERAHKAEIERVQAQVRDAEERARKHIEDAEARAERRVKEVEDNARRQLEEIKKAEERRFNDMKDSLERRLADAKERAERDLAAATLVHDQRREAQKEMYENRITVMQQELNRERAATKEAREEVANKKDIVGQITELEATASALGWQKGGEPSEEMPSDWKGIFAHVARDLFKNAPDMIATATESVRSLRGQPSQMAAMQAGAMQAPPQLPPQGGAYPPPLRGRDGEVFVPSQPLSFASEDGPDFEPAETSFEPPREAPPEPHQPGQVYSSQPAPEPPPQGPPMGAPPPQPPAPQPAAAMHQQPPQAPPQQQPMTPPLQQGAPAQIPDDMIVQFAPALKAAFEAEISPEEAAEGIIQQVGTAQAAVIAASLSPERIISVLSQQPGAINNPLLTRDGQQYLVELIQSVATQAAAGG